MIMTSIINTNGGVVDVGVKVEESYNAEEGGTFFTSILTEFFLQNCRDGDTVNDDVLYSCC